jgi:hypothetical protein
LFTLEPDTETFEPLIGYGEAFLVLFVFENAAGLG